MQSSLKATGKIGETYAAEYLTQHGYVILQMNFTCQWGEIDIVAQKNEKLVFVEVKTRVGDSRGKPYEAIRYHKMSAFVRAIQIYLLKNNVKKCKLCADAISVTLNPDYSVSSLKHYENLEIPVAQYH